MVSAISNSRVKFNTYKPSFGSVVMSRVVLRTVEKNGDIYYTPLLNNEKGIVGIYQSLSKQVNKSKKLDFLKKLSAAIPDFNIKKPILHSTLIGVRSSFRRFLLTGADARKARDLGTDLIGALNNRKSYSTMMKEQILSQPQKRIFNENGDELGIDLIVEGPQGKRKLVDIEILTLQDILKYKQTIYASNKKEMKKLNELDLSKKQPKQVKKTKNKVQEEAKNTAQNIKEEQKEFDFVSQLTSKKINPRDYD